MTALSLRMGHNLQPKNLKIFARHLWLNTSQPPPHHSRINNQAECFVDMFKRVLKKAKGKLTDTAIKQFLQVYSRVTPNKKAP